MVVVLVFAGLAPHPPVIVPEVGGGELKKVNRTVEAMREWARLAAAARPEVLVFVSPHSVFLRFALGYLGSPELSGSFAAFGAPEVSFRVPNSLELAAKISEAAGSAGFRLVRVEEPEGRILDHGVLVPLYYLREAGVDASLLVFGISLLPLRDLFRFGELLGEVAARDERRIGIVASGDLSHRLQPGAPAGYDPQGKVFDETIRDSLARMDAEAVLNLPEELVERAGECGLRPVVILLGALRGRQPEPRIHSYEGPFGVGYLVASFRLPVPEQRLESSFVRLARASLEHYLRTGQMLPVPDPVPPEMQGRAGVFVSLKKRGQLRGCIGTVVPTRENIAAEIIHNAVSAGLHDPRFLPVTLEELPELKISVDVLSPPEPVASEADLDPKRYGVIVRSGGRLGLLLPDLEGIDTPAEQVRIARQKAGIGPDEPVQLERFEVRRYE